MGAFTNLPNASLIDYSHAWPDDHDEYPHHFIMHLTHCAEVVAYKHPNKTVRLGWRMFYQSACDAFHMTEETEQEMDDRLNDFLNSPPKNKKG